MVKKLRDLIFRAKYAHEDKERDRKLWQTCARILMGHGLDIEAVSEKDEVVNENPFAFYNRSISHKNMAL